MVKFVLGMELIQLVVVLTAIFSVSGNEISVSTGSSSVNVRPGEQANLECTASAPIAFCVFTSPSGTPYFVKQGVNYGRITPAEGKDCVIQISDVTDEDAGDWKCTITSIPDGGVAITGENGISVTVLKAPSSVRLDIDGPITITPENPTATVRCIAEGGDPVPSFSWTLDAAPAKVTVVDSGEEGAGHYQEVTITPRKEDNGKHLECIANSEAYTADDLADGLNKAGSQLDVQFAPVFFKDVYEFYGLSIGEPFDIKIGFTLNPPPETMEWVMQDGTKVPQGSESGDGKYISALAQPEEGESADHHSATLTIHDVSEKDGGTTNKLVVKNAHGQAEISFKLELGEKPPTGADLISDGTGSHSDEAGTGPVIAIVIIILLVIVVIAVGIVARSQKILCFAGSDGVSDPEKGKFSALEKEEDCTPEKETKDILKNDPADSAAALAPAEVKAPAPAGDAAPAPGPAPAEDKKSNGGTSPAK